MPQRQRRKHVNVKPPAIMPKEVANSLPADQVPIIPPMAMLANSQKNQIASLKPALKVRARILIMCLVARFKQIERI
jgi:hypothetical protein